MKKNKLVSLVLVFAMILSLGVTAMAAPSNQIVDGADRIWQDGFGFHCNAANGNGQTSVIYAGDSAAVKASIAKIKKQPAGSLLVLKGDQKDIFGTATYQIRLERVGDTTAWNLMTGTDIVCETCGRTDWVTYSNNSGVINGKNIQAHHPDLPPPPPPVVYGSLSILKTVGGVPFLDWARSKGLDAAGIDDIIAGMNFVAYLMTGADGVRVSPEVSYQGVMSPLDGIIGFGQVRVGWYEVVETISGAASTYFAGSNGATNLYFVDNSSLAGSTSAMANFVSGQNGVGTLVKCDANCSFGDNVFSLGTKEHVLPDVWNGQLAGSANFQKLMDMNAQWIWDYGCTHIYGKSGSVYSDTFTFNAAEAGSATLYFAADNAAVVYVNGKLAGYTEVAFEKSGSGLEPAALLDDFDWTGLNASVFNGGWADGWCYAYDTEINFNKGFNTLTIIALNSIGTDGTGTPNDTYNEVNNPCGLIFGFAVPAITFDNEESPDVQSGIKVVPMASIGYFELADGDTWGLEVWPQNGYKDMFKALSGYEDGDFANSLGDVQGEFIWDKSQADVNTNEYGEDVGYFRFEYKFDYANPRDIEFSDFTIAADNEFALIVNGTIIQISDNFKVVAGIDEGFKGDLADIFDIEYLAQFTEGFWALNDPGNNLYGKYGWNIPYTINGYVMREAFLASGDDSVVIEVYTYNIPEDTDREGYPYKGMGNPAMLIFAGSFKYEYDYTI